MAIGQSEAVFLRPRRLSHLGTVAEVSDGQLLARFMAEREESAQVAFATLVRRHAGMVLRVCQQIVGDRHLAEDAFQATFMILARRAGSIRQPELLGHWLHGVAVRTAREARMRDVRRRRRETPAGPRIDREPIDDQAGVESPLIRREEFEAIHSEVARLPERYRIPVVLCDLEGLTHQQAAEQLSCPVGTIGVRLKRARQRLREQLTRRGVVPSAGVMAAVLGADAAAALTDSSLINSTIQAGIEFAASTGTNSLVSTSVTTLAEAVLRTMAIARLKLPAILALAVGMTGTIGWLGIERREPALTRQAHIALHPLAEASPSALHAVASTPSIAQPRDVAIPPLKPSPEALAARANPGLTQEPQPTAERPTEDVLFKSSQRRQQELMAQSTAKGTKAETAAPLNAKVGRALREDQALGQLLFAKEWAVNDPASHGGDGLGPVYNETSCVGCHGLGGPGGAGPESKNVILVTASPNGCGPTQSLAQIHPGFRNSRSTVIHRFGSDPEYALWRRRFFDPNAEKGPKTQRLAGEEAVKAVIKAVRQQSLMDRQRINGFQLPAVNGFALTLVERNTPALFGLGQIDEISSDELVAVAENQPAEVRGRVSRTKQGRIGRYGWKAQIPSLHEFVRAACANELGLEVPGHSQARSPLDPSRKPDGYDLNEEECDALVAFMRALPAPVAVDLSGPQGTKDMLAGRVLFAELECTACHSPTLGNVQGIYSDLLLHNMGQSLSDPAGSYGFDSSDSPEAPTAREWRTPPLWGYRDSGPYMHDGRAQSLEEAVALHEGQGTKSARKFFALSAREQSQVEAFLKSLVAPAAASNPGIVLAAEMESRLEPHRSLASEAVLRQRKEQNVARDEEQWREAQRRRRAEVAAKRAKVQIPIAESLEKMGKINGALTFYRQIAREAYGTEEGRLAATRITELSTRTVAP